MRKYLLGTLAIVAAPTLILISILLGFAYFGLVEKMGPLMGVKIH